MVNKKSAGARRVSPLRNRRVRGRLDCLHRPQEQNVLHPSCLFVSGKTDDRKSDDDRRHQKKSIVPASDEDGDEPQRSIDQKNHQRKITIVDFNLHFVLLSILDYSIQLCVLSTLS